MQQPLPWFFAQHSAAWRSAVIKQPQSATVLPIGASKASCTTSSQAALLMSSSQDLPPGAADRELEGLLHSAARPLVEGPAPSHLPRGATGGLVARQALAEVRSSASAQSLMC